MFSIIYMVIAVIWVAHAETTDTSQQTLLETSSISPASFSKPTTVGIPSNILFSIHHHNDILNSALDLHKNLQLDSDNFINSNIEEDDMETAESSIVFMPLFATRRKAEKRKAQKRKENSNSEPASPVPHKTNYYYATPYYYSANYRPSYSNYPSYSNNYPSNSNNYPSYSSYPTYSNSYQSYPSNSQYPSYYPNSNPTYEYPTYYYP